MELADTIVAVSGISSFVAMIGSLLYKWLHARNALKQAQSAATCSVHVLEIDINGRKLEIDLSDKNSASNRVDEAIQAVREHAAA